MGKRLLFVLCLVIALVPTTALSQTKPGAKGLQDTFGTLVSKWSLGKQAEVEPFLDSQRLTLDRVNRQRPVPAGHAAQQASIISFEQEGVNVTAKIQSWYLEPRSDPDKGLNPVVLVETFSITATDDERQFKVVDFNCEVVTNRAVKQTREFIAANLSHFETPAVEAGERQQYGLIVLNELLLVGDMAQVWKIVGELEAMHFEKEPGFRTLQALVRNASSAEAVPEGFKALAQHILGTKVPD